MEAKKVILVTGGARGIGASIVKQMAEAGWAVCLCYRYSKESAETLENAFTDVWAIRADVRNRKEVEAMVEQCLNHFGRIDAVVNNAGIAQSRLFTDITADEWDEMLDTHLKGAFNVTQSVLPHMISEKRGKIINIASIWGMVGASCEVHYSTAKAGLIGMTKALAKEVGPSNIQVNCVAPGIIDTDMMAEFSEEDRSVLRDETPLMRLGTPEDVAYVVAFLASERASFITGQVISPNGGFVI
jgi:3-oxoacyl-[acyl-carrier protein] reductase